MKRFSAVGIRREPEGNPPPVAVSSSTQITRRVTLRAIGGALATAPLGLLAARGTSVTQDWILSSIGADTRSAVRGASGDILEWGNPYVTFVGDVNGSEVTSTGYGVCFGPIAAAARAAGHAAIGAQGWTATAIYRALSAGHPVVIWTDTSFAAAPTRTWTARDGRAVRYAIGEHAVTMTGIDVDHRTVQLLDVETGRFRVFTTAQFTEFWWTFGNMAVVVA